MRPEHQYHTILYGIIRTTMKPRSLLFLLSLLPLCACQLSQDSVSYTGAPHSGSVKMPLSTPPQSAKGSVALSMFCILAKETPGNVVFSPASLESTLRTLKKGARGNTAALLRQLPEPQSAPTMNILAANGVFVNKTIQLKPGIADNDLVSLDFGSQEANSYITNWVKEKTNGFIPNFSSSAAQNPYTQLLIVNALYLKERWDSPFDSKDTQTEDFTDSDGRKHRVEMMHQTNMMAYAQGKNWQAIALPYQSGGYFIAILPQGNAHTFAASLTPQLYHSIISELVQKNREIELGLPEFNITTETTSLAQALGKSGFGDLFSGKADLSGFTGSPLPVQDVVQLCRIKLDEEGTEAAAVTEIPIWLLDDPTPPKPLKLTFDRPFIWIITEPDTANTPYFMGIFEQP